MMINSSRNSQPNRQRIRKFIWLAAGISFFLGVFLLNVSKLGKEVSGCLAGCAPEKEEDDRFLRILSLNMLHEHPDYRYISHRSDLIVAEIDRLNVDIVLLQEVPNIRKQGDMAAYLAQQTGMNYAYVRANGNRKLIGFEEGELILSRFPLKDVHFAELSPQAAFFEHRVVLHATVEMPHNDLDLYVTHLTNDDTIINAAQADDLSAYVAQTTGKTAVIAGDFNATEETPQIVKLSENWIDSYRAAHPDLSGFTCCVDNLLNGDPASFDERVDYLFISPGDVDVIVQDAQLVLKRPFPTSDGALWASDHIGLLVTLEMPSSRD